ncbi:hypothetical protein BLNAU_4987 [Blattamonas nauphoetae]|uniref:Uncharacterized protein n=1 Tax=Blattamonas nauphoetae TaxID=2049346 RepID=A0ABQ9Y8U2_9EUKA|nr:hypothetical protein BLNAU_4987 [Blattamonas nauphoetae]
MIFLAHQLDICPLMFLEFGGISKTCLTADTACHSLDQAVKHVNWENVNYIAILGHAELIGEVTFDTSADNFQTTPPGDVTIEMCLGEHFLSSNTDHYGLTGMGTIKIKGTSNAKMTLTLYSNVSAPPTPGFVISTSRTPDGTKKDYVFRVEQYGVLDITRSLFVLPLQLLSYTTFTKLTSKFETEPWDQKSAAIIVNQGTIKIANFVEVTDPELGVLILKDINTTESSVVLLQDSATSLTSLVPKGIVCSIPENATKTFNIRTFLSGIQRKEGLDLVEIDQYPLDIHLSGKCAVYDSEDTTQKFPLNNTDMTNISKAAFVFPTVTLTRSNLKFATKTGSQSSELGNYLLAEFTSQTASLGVAALRRLKVSVAPRYHTEDVDDKLIRWDEMTWYVGQTYSAIENGGVTIKQSGQSNYAVAAVPRANVGISGEYTVKMEFDDQVRYVGFWRFAEPFP